VSWSLFAKLAPYLDPDLDADVVPKFIEASGAIVSQVSLKPWEQDRPYRLTLDYQEDLDMFTELYSKMPITASGTDIIYFLDRHPEVPAINWDKQQEWKENQDHFNQQVKL
jgi:spore coat polysaccharide biosynthesis protein SpsF (cytidylyltransferase family)